LKYQTTRVAVALLLLVAGCRASDHPTGPELAEPGRPLFDVGGLDCQLNAARCAVIQAGIDAMKAHANTLCQNMGNAAQVRYDAGFGIAGFREEAANGTLDMSVYTNLSTGAPLDGYTNVYPGFWSNPFIGQNQATGALIAHEEAHHQGANETEAQAVQNTCLNPQA
jgi:hypothetical protein